MLGDRSRFCVRQKDVLDNDRDAAGGASIPMSCSPDLQTLSMRLMAYRSFHVKRTCSALTKKSCCRSGVIDAASSQSDSEYQPDWIGIVFRKLAIDIYMSYRRFAAPWRVFAKNGSLVRWQTGGRSAEI